MRTYGKRLLTLVADSELIQHREQFRDSRRGNTAIRKRMQWLKNLNNHWNTHTIQHFTRHGVTRKKENPRNYLKVTIIHEN